MPYSPLRILEREDGADGAAHHLGCGWLHEVTSNAEFRGALFDTTLEFALELVGIHGNQPARL